MEDNQIVTVTFIGGATFSYSVSKSEAVVVSDLIKSGKSVVSFLDSVGNRVFINVYRSDKIEITKPSK